MSFRSWLLLLMAFTIVSRLHALNMTGGMIHPDSIYQYLEPVHIKIFGYGLMPWEYVDGIRSWFFPGMIYIIFNAGLLAGVSDILKLIFAVRALMMVVSILLVYAVYRLADAAYNRRTGLLAGFFTAASGLLYLWSARIMPEVPAALAVTGGLYFLLGSLKGRKHDAIFSGILLGIAFMLKFNSAVYLMPLAAYLLIVRKVEVLGYFSAGFAIVLLFQGLIDLATWGSFLHSPVAFFMANLVEKKSSIFGTEPPVYYLLPLLLHVPIMFFLPWSFERKRTAGLLWGTFLIYFTVFSLIPHKEMRFMFSALPLFFILSARGLDRMVEQSRPSYQQNIVVKYMFLSFIFIVLGAQLLIFFELPGQWGGGWTPFEDNFQAVRYVGQQDDAKALAYSIHWYLSGVYTYFHRDIPSYHIVDLEFASSPQLKDRYVIPHSGFNTIGLDEITDHDINYVIITSPNESVNDFLEEVGYNSVKSCGNVTVYKR